jgi:hypothetical protein
MKAKEFASVPDEDENLRRMLKTPPKPHASLKSRGAKATPSKRKNVEASKTAKASDAS